MTENQPTYEDVLNIASEMNDDELHASQTIAESAIELLTLVRENAHRIAQRNAAGHAEASRWVQRHQGDPHFDLYFSAFLSAQGVIAVDQILRSINLTAITQDGGEAPFHVRGTVNLLNSFKHLLRREVQETGVTFEEVADWTIAMKNEEEGNASHLMNVLNAQTVCTVDLLLQVLRKSVEQISLIRSVNKTVEGI